MLSQIGKEKVFVVGRLAPVRLLVRGAGRCGRGWGRRRGAGKLLIEVGSWSAHAWSRGPPERALLLWKFCCVSVEGEFFTTEGTSSSLRETERPMIAGHSENAVAVQRGEGGITEGYSGTTGVERGDWQVVGIGGWPRFAEESWDRVESVNKSEPLEGRVDVFEIWRLESIESKQRAFSWGGE